MSVAPVRLTEYSHGAGCGCKISPRILETILASKLELPHDARLLVGYATKDDAAAYSIDDRRAILSTTDFFMPIVDDPFDFGRIAATNAISDIYAMGGTPLLAIAILGWPVQKLSAEIAQRVVDGGRRACADAGIPLAGGHSIDSPEPIFGLAVTGEVAKAQLKQNCTAGVGDLLYLTKPLGVGILTTAQKQKKLRDEHADLARDVMCRLNKVGALVSRHEAVSAMTDVTGFGLMGHLLEVCEGSGVNARVSFDAVPRLTPAMDYIDAGCVPGGTQRNFESFGERLGPMAERQRSLLCDPQTSGGLLICVRPQGREAVEEILRENHLHCTPIGELVAQTEGPRIEVK